MQTSARKAAGWRSRSALKVRRPLVEQLAHLRRIGRTWIARGATPMRWAQARTSVLNSSTGTVSSSGAQSQAGWVVMAVPSRGQDRWSWLRPPQGAEQVVHNLGQILHAGSTERLVQRQANALLLRRGAGPVGMLVEGDHRLAGDSLGGGNTLPLQEPLHGEPFGREVARAARVLGGAHLTHQCLELA